MIALCVDITLSRFRRLLGELGVEKLLAQTINTVFKLKLTHAGETARLARQPLRYAHAGQFKYCQTIEPGIGHLKADHRMDRCHLEGQLGDVLYTVLCAAGYKVCWLLRQIGKHGIRAFLHVCFMLLLGRKNRKMPVHNEMIVGKNRCSYPGNGLNRIVQKRPSSLWGSGVTSS